MTNTPEHLAWQHMRRRCEEPSNKSFADYGARGITVCERWQRFENFFADMGKKPSPHHSLERQDNSKGYEPGNCARATRAEQNNNTRRNRVITYKGKSMTVAQWAREIGIPVTTLGQRLTRLKMPVEEALSRPRRRMRLHHRAPSV